MEKPEVLMVLKQGTRKDPPTAAERLEPFAVVRCPDCKGAATVDLDQYQGKVSILCAAEVAPRKPCGYHETHDLRT